MNSFSTLREVPHSIARLINIFALVGAAALFLAVFFRAIRKVSPVPVRDPYLAESLHYHH